jgi:hypothetical protein
VCLSQLYDDDESTCPIYRRSLFIYRSWRSRVYLRYFVITSIATTFVFSYITIAIHIFTPQTHYQPDVNSIPSIS